MDVCNCNNNDTIRFHDVIPPDAFTGAMWIRDGYKHQQLVIVMKLDNIERKTMEWCITSHIDNGNNFSKIKQKKNMAAIMLQIDIMHTQHLVPPFHVNYDIHKN